MENILTLGKLFSLWFCFLLHSILFLIISNLLLASERSERDTLMSVQLRIADIYIYYYV